MKPSTAAIRFLGPVVSHALYKEHVGQISEAGADRTYLTLHEAGRSLALHALEKSGQDQVVSP